MIDSAIVRLSGDTNAVVVQLPERKHPGIVIQGDSLLNLRNLLETAQRQLAERNFEEAAEVIEEVRELVDGYVASYAQAVAASQHG